MANRSRISHHGVGGSPCSGVPIKNGYCLDDDEFCLPAFPVFSSSNDLWNQYGDMLQDDESCQLGEGATDAGPSRTSQSQLEHLSSRQYSVRASDPNDFASVWENLVPFLMELLQKHCEFDFAVDVHNFPEISSDAVPRVIYVTLAEAIDAATEQYIRTEVARRIPPKFNPVYMKFRIGSVQKCAYWGEGEKDSVCEPRNITFRYPPKIGISIGPILIRDAASLGGLIEVGGQTYAMSAYHAFHESTKSGNMRVKHPAEPDLEMNLFQDPEAGSYQVGTVTMYSPEGTLRSSLTFQGTNIPADDAKVEMDWCLIGPIPNGENVVSIPTFRVDRLVTVQNTAEIRGNTEVYALARTSGYSLGFTSDFPGLQRIGGKFRREWTVRQYSPFKNPTDGQMGPPWQTLKQWVTSGIGVPGDSGAWLIRRSDNALMGLIWGRNYDRGSPLQRVRLTYFTPIVDILADIQENHTVGESVSLPVCAAETMLPGTGIQGQRAAAVQGSLSQEPWSTWARDSIRPQREADVALIQRSFVGGIIPPSSLLHPRQQTAALDDFSSSGTPQAQAGSAVLSGNPRRSERSTAAAERYISPPRSEEHGSFSTLRSRDRLLLGLNPPELSVASSVGSVSSPLSDSSEDASATSNAVRILDEDNMGEDIVDVEEPIRSKASFSLEHPGFGNTEGLRMQVAL